MQVFIPFSILHFLIIAGGIILVLLTAKYAHEVRSEKQYRRDANIFLLLMAGIYLLLTITKLIQGEWTIQGNLPLHLCDISAWTLVYALNTKKQWAFEAGYFWGMAGALLAFAVPNIQKVDWYMIPFFVWHALLAAAPIYYLIAKKTFPTQRGLWRSIGLTIIVGLIVKGINHWLGSNYMFVNEKIPAMDLLGFPDYPTYIFLLIPIMIALFYIFWLPFRKRS
jgi:hypothetical integral membrane protein (TIGR02206 family)